MIDDNKEIKKTELEGRETLRLMCIQYSEWPHGVQLLRDQEKKKGDWKKKGRHEVKPIKDNYIEFRGTQKEKKVP